MFSNKKHMSDWHNYFLICHDIKYEGTQLTKSHTVISSRLTFLPSDMREHVTFYTFILCSAHRVSTDLVAELHSRIPYVVGP